MKFFLFFSFFLIFFTCQNPEDSLNSNKPVKVWIKYPKSDTTVVGIVSIECATDNDSNVKSIELMVDSLKTGLIDYDTPFLIEWDTRSYPKGSEHFITLIAINKGGDSSYSESILLKVDNSSILAPPPSKVLSVKIDGDKVVVNWSKAKTNKFKFYQLFHAEKSLYPKQLINTIYSINDTTIKLSNFNLLPENWFWIQVYDSLDYSSVFGSGYQFYNDPPKESNIYPIMYLNASFIVRWAKNTDTDFQQYNLYESTSPVMNDPQLIYSSNNVNDTSFIVENIDYDKFRYYRVDVLDFWDLHSLSDIERGSSYPLITYNSVKSENSEIYIMDIDGENKQQLTSSNGKSDKPVFSPDGNLILFRSLGNLNIMDKYGRNERQIVTESIISEYSFTPDGNKLIYICDLGAYRAIYTIDVDGSNQKQLTFGDEQIKFSAFSPDNAIIVYTAEKNDTTSIWKIDFNGQNKTRLTSDYMYNSDLDFSPDGKSIVYIANDLPGGEDIFVLDLNTHTSVNITYTPNIMEFHPKFSPDGEYIYFEAYSNNSDICRIDTDGNNMTNITNSPNSEVSIDLLHDGSLIVFRSSITQNNEIFTISTNGMDLKRLTNNNFDDLNPKFQKRN